MIMRRLTILFCFLFYLFSLKAQTYTETGKIYPLSIDDNKQVVSGFISFKGLSDKEIYANALLWTIENICPKLREGITEVNVSNQSFTCDLILIPQENSGQNSTFYCQAVFRVAEGKLTYYLSDIKVESPLLVIKKVTPIERLTPDKKELHKQSINDFVKTESRFLNKMFDFITTHSAAGITHWQEISIEKPVKGMTEDECRLAFGKPQTIMETNGEVQWMYSSSFYLFFKDGRVQTIIN